MIKKIAAALSIVIVLIATPAAVLAQSTNVITVPQDEIIDQNPYFAYGDVVEIRGTINGDAYIAAGEVIIDGVINGDLFVAGGNVKVGGVITQGVRVAGGQVVINADIGRGATVVGGNIELTQPGVIEGSLVGAGGNVSVSLPVNAGVKIAAGNISVLSNIGGNLETATGALRLGPEASVEGELNYISDREANIHENATVSGQINRTEVEDREQIRDSVVTGVGRINVMARIISALGTLLVGLILIWLSPKFMDRAASTINSKPLLSLGVGLLAVVLTPIAVVALLVTIIGIPIAFIVLALYFIYLYIAKIFVIYWLGIKLVKGTQMLTFLAGLVVYFVISLIPVLGGIVGMLALLFGVGASLIAEKAVWQEARKKAII